MLSVYNTNVESQHGLILRVTRKDINIYALTVDKDQKHKSLTVEVFCFKSGIVPQYTDICELYFDVEIHPLQLTHIYIS